MDVPRHKSGSILLLIIIVFCYCFVIGTNLFVREHYQAKTNHDTRYGFPFPFPIDNLQYFSLIRAGQEGNILWTNQYSELSMPKMFIQFHYFLLGIITKPFAIDQFQAFTLARYLGLIAVTSAVIITTFSIIKSRVLIGTTILNFLFVTSFYKIVNLATLNVLDYETYTNYFNIVRKLIHIPPHHYLAILLLLLIGKSLQTIKSTFRSLLSTFLYFFVLSFVHPYLVVIGLYLMIAVVISGFLTEKKRVIIFCVHTITALVAASPSLLYNYYLLHTVFQGKTVSMAGLNLSKSMVTPENLILSLGPLFFVALFAFFLKDVWISTTKRYLLFWMILPILLYYLSNIIPVGGLRLFQTYQHIPIVLLSGIIFQFLSRRFTNKFRYLYVAITIGVISFSVPALITYGGYFASPLNPYGELADNIEKLRPLLNYLKTQTPPKSVVISNETIGMIIPAFSNNHVILGHLGNNIDYESKRFEIDAFYHGQIPPTALTTIFDKYHARYVIFQPTAYPIHANLYGKLPIFTTIYQDTNYILMKIN